LILAGWALSVDCNQRLRTNFDCEIGRNFFARLAQVRKNTVGAPHSPYWATGCMEQFNEAEALSLGAASCRLAASPAEDARIGALVFEHAGTVAVLYDVAASRGRAAFQTAECGLGFFSATPLASSAIR
jgi:hypothetical protein